jgi:CheY-like chemotaxis protein
MKRFKECYGGRGIAISGFGQPEDLERSHRAGFSHHLVKPIDPELLRATLEEACLAEAQAGNVTV